MYLVVGYWVTMEIVSLVYAPVLQSTTSSRTKKIMEHLEELVGVV